MAIKYVDLASGMTPPGTGLGCPLQEPSRRADGSRERRGGAGGGAGGRQHRQCGWTTAAPR
jgi:hypothetical protein